MLGVEVEHMCVGSRNYLVQLRGLLQGKLIDLAVKDEPRSGLRLLQRALDVLRFQWDEQKNIDRQRSTPLDGRDRVTVLKNIAVYCQVSLCAATTG